MSSIQSDNFFCYLDVVGGGTVTDVVFKWKTHISHDYYNIIEINVYNLFICIWYGWYIIL